MTIWADLLGVELGYAGSRRQTRVAMMGEGPPLLLLHGTGGHIENWARNMARLSHSFRVIALDFLWHGLSDTRNFDPELIPPLVAQVIDLMDDLGIDRAAIEGQSLGGWIAMATALRHPDRVAALILTTTQGYVPDDGALPGYVEPDWAANLPSTLAALREPTTHNIRQRMARILASPDRLTDEAIEVRRALYARPALAEVQMAFVHEYLGGGEASRQHVVTDALARTIDCPTLVYWGDRNRTPPALGRHIADTVSDGRFHCADDTGHWAQFESAEEHDRVVGEFLQSLPLRAEGVKW